MALDFAYHSSWFEPVEHVFKAAVGKLEIRPPTLPVISTVTGDLNDRFDADYWWQNLRQPVLYQQAVERALHLGGDTFIELGPHRTLSNMTAACAAAKGHMVGTVSTLDRRWGDLMSIAVATGQLYVSGVGINWSSVLGAGGRDISLPRRPWILNELWNEPEEAARVMQPPTAHPLLGQHEPTPSPSWSNEISLATHSYLRDHRLDGECVFPAAAYLDMLTGAARKVLGCYAIELVDVTFPAALYFGAEDILQFRTVYEPILRRLTINSRLRDGTGGWQLRAQATIFPLQRAARAEAIDLPSSCTAIDPAEFYRSAGANGFGWGRQFQGLRSISAHCGAAVGEIVIEDTSVHTPTSFTLDPRAIDSALQLMLACDAQIGSTKRVPVAVARVAVHGTLSNECSATAKTRTAGNDIIATVTIASGPGIPAVHLDGIRARSNRQRLAPAKHDNAVPRFYMETFAPITMDPPTQPKSGTWLLLAAENCSISQRICDALGARGEQVKIFTPSADTAIYQRTYLEAFRSCFARSPLAGIVYAPPLSCSTRRHSDIAAAASDGVMRATAFGQALAQFAADEPMPTITVLTHGARVLETQDVMTDGGIAQSALLGLFRTIALEVPDIALQLIDLDDDALHEPGIALDILTTATPETEFLVRSGKAYVARLGEVGTNELTPSSIPRSKLGRSRNFALRHTGPPGTDGMRWQLAPLAPIGPDDVTVEVRAVGLNFRDVMAVSGLLPEHAEPTPAIEALGLELSGIVVARGANVRELNTGDHVLGMARGALQRYVTCPASSLHQAPAGLMHVQAATIPSAFLTAHYALNHIARLQSGESILIHSATGGVGLAAIALARRAGARIIATAGSPQKREYLTHLGIGDVFDSRSLDFADDVMRTTGGRGVDVVLNALEGPFIDKGLTCLAPYGRFLELGKRDVYADSALGLRRLRSNISFHVIDVAALIADKPERAAIMLGDVLSLLHANEIEALPVSTYGASDIGDAVRLMAGARHIGKVVVQLDDPDVEFESGLADGALLDPDGTYLVTGGTSGFGRAVGEWLAARGAGRVILASRNADLGKDKSCSAKIKTLCLDVTDAEQVADAVASMTKSDKPLRGIIHAAVVYDDALLSNMTTDRICRVLAPKIEGALNLNRAVASSGAQLDFFVSFSSLAQVVGWTGQSNYAAANSLLEGLAHLQRARGIPGRCINWGALDESGHVARSKKMRSYLATAGWIGIDNETAIAYLAKALDSDPPALTIAAADWMRLAATHPALARSPRTAGLTSAAQTGTDPLSHGLTALHGDELEAAALRLVCTEAAKVLRTSTDDLAARDTLDEAGIDSLSTFELRLRIEQRLGLEVPMSRYVQASRFHDLATLARALVEEARARER